MIPGLLIRVEPVHTIFKPFNVTEESSKDSDKAKETIVKEAGP